jgi:DnaJ-class molecular chaperone
MTMGKNRDCPRCHGYGEVAVPGTYGATISPEMLELVRCYLCDGTGEIRKGTADDEEQPGEFTE